MHPLQKQQNYMKTGTSLVVHWVRLRARNAEGPGSIPGPGTRSLKRATTEESACCN